MKIAWLFFLNAAAGCPYANSDDSLRRGIMGKRSTNWNSFYTPTMSDTDWTQLRANVATLLAQSLGPKLVRNGFRDAMTYSAVDGTGGPHAQFLLDPKNNEDLALVQQLMQGVQGVISKADVISFAAACAVSASNPAGVSVPWRPGRNDAVDSADSSFSASNGKTDAVWDGKGVRTWFARLGFTDDKDHVALMGAHNLGNCHLQVSGYAGPWTTTPLSLTNEYFIRLYSNSVSQFYTNATVTYQGSSKWQWVDSRGRMMLPVEISIADDPSYSQYINGYALHESAFLTDFVDAFSRLLEVGVSSGLGSPVDTSITPASIYIPQPKGSMCYPHQDNPIVCVTSKSDGAVSTIFTVHSIKSGWAAFGVGTDSMDGGDVVVGWLNSTNSAVTQFFSTYKHGINVNSNSAWRQIPLAEVPPSWAKISYSVVHLNTIASDSNIKGNSLNNHFIFALSTYPPSDPDLPGTPASFYQHELSGIFGDSASTDGQGNTNTGSSNGISGGIIAVIVLCVLLLAGSTTAWYLFRKGYWKVLGQQQQNQLQNIQGSSSSQTLALTDAPKQSNYLIADQREEPLTARVLLTQPLNSQNDHIVVIPSTRSSTVPMPIDQRVLGPIPLQNREVSAGHTRPDATPIPVKDNALFYAMRAAVPATKSLAMQIQSSKDSKGEIEPVVTEFDTRVAELAKLGDAFFPVDPFEWGVTEVAAWILKHGGSNETTSIVAREKINGRVLMVTRLSDLCGVLGIESFGGRVLFEEGIMGLKKRFEKTEDINDEPPLYMG